MGNMVKPSSRERPARPNPAKKLIKTHPRRRQMILAKTPLPLLSE
jgi:hypothetical protein